MIEGTKARRNPAAEAKVAEGSTTNSEPAALAAAANAAAPADPERRAWFRSLGPMLGNGLVELLRASNNLKRDLREITEKEK